MTLLSQQLNSPRAALIIVAVVYGLFLHAYLAANNYQPSQLIEAADHFVDPAQASNIYVVPNSTGYDGQFYYRLALDPFTSEQTEYGVTLDSPAYRHQRIVYPMLVWLFSFGGHDAVPVMLIVVNYLAACLLGWVAGHLAQSAGHHALEGLALAFYPGFVWTLSRDLAEIVAALLVLAGLLAIRRGLATPATGLLILAVLTKETALLAPASLAVAALLSARRPPWYSYTLPLLAYALWQLILFWNWGHWALSSGGVNVGAPLAGLQSFVLDIAAGATRSHRIWLVELCFLAVLTLVALMALRGSTAPLHEKAAWLLYGILAISLTRQVWGEDRAFLRALTEFYLLGGLVVLGSRRAYRYPLLVGSIGLWLFLASELARTH